MRSIFVISVILLVLFMLACPLKIVPQSAGAYGDATYGQDVDVTRLNDGGNSITVDDGGTALTNRELTLISNTTTTDPDTNLYTPASGNQLRIYAVHVSLYNSAGADELVRVYCSGGTKNIMRSYEPAVTGEYVRSPNPNYITCPVDEAIAIDIPATSIGAAIDLLLEEVTP